MSGSVIRSGAWSRIGPRSSTFMRLPTINNNKRGRMTAHKSSRVKTRSNTINQQLAVTEFRPVRVPLPVEPPTVQNTITVQKTFQRSFTIPGTTFPSKLDVRVADLQVPMSAAWQRVRFQSAKLWLDSTPTQAGAPTRSSLTVTIPGVQSWNQPPMVFTDSGSSGIERARVGFRLGLLDRASWFGLGDTTVLFTVEANVVTTVTAVLSVELLGGQ